MYSVQAPLLAFKDFLLADSSDRLVIVLDALDLEPLLRVLGSGRRRGRRGHSPQTLLYALMAAWVHGLRSIAELRRELVRNGSLRLLCGIPSVKAVPAEDAFHRALARLAKRPGVVEAVFNDAVARLADLVPDLGRETVIDSTPMPAWSEGNRKEPSDPDAGWGKLSSNLRGKSGWWFGYKVHLAVDARAEMPLAYTVTPANVADSTQAEGLLDKATEVLPADRLQVAIMDAGYDAKDVYSDVHGRGAVPIIDFNDRGWAPPPGYDAEGCPLCECGQPLRYLGRDREYVKYGRGQCCELGRAIRRWRVDDDIRLHPPLPRHTKKWARLYAKRTAVERVNSRLKEHGRLRSLRHRGLEKARLHASLTLLVMVAGALGMMQNGHREFARSVVQLVA